MDYQFALITEERKLNGMFASGTISFNTTIANMNSYKTYKLLDTRKINDAAIRQIHT